LCEIESEKVDKPQFRHIISVGRTFGDGILFAKMDQIDRGGTLFPRERADTNKVAQTL